MTDDRSVALAKAAANARFVLHCMLLEGPEQTTARISKALDAGNQDLAVEISSQEGMRELAAEALSGLQAALTIFYDGAPPPICRGCSPLSVQAHGFDENYRTTTA
jgi:hypothetical protein